MDAAEEARLTDALLRRGHLSVPDRRALGQARLSVVCAVIQRGLARDGWFPRPPETDTLGAWAAITQNGMGRYEVHAQHEIGVMRSGPVEVVEADGLEAAVHLYLRACGTERAIDGVPIDLSG